MPSSSALSANLSRTSGRKRMLIMIAGPSALGFLPGRPFGGVRLFLSAIQSLRSALCESWEQGANCAATGHSDV
jgi:hypothetical protein